MLLRLQSTCPNPRYILHERRYSFGSEDLPCELTAGCADQVIYEDLQEPATRPQVKCQEPGHKLSLWLAKCSPGQGFPPVRYGVRITRSELTLSPGTES
jgi:hypothetical protein